MKKLIFLLMMTLSISFSYEFKHISEAPATDAVITYYCNNKSEVQDERDACWVNLTKKALGELNTRVLRVLTLKPDGVIDKTIIDIKLSAEYALELLHPQPS